MDKAKWKNLYHAFRWMKRYTTEKYALGWIAFFSLSDRRLLERVIGEADA